IAVEDLQKMTKSFTFCFEAELLVLLQRLAVNGRVILEGNAVQTEVRAEMAFLRLAIDMAALNVVERRRAERQRRLGRVLAAAENVDVRRIVDARRGRDRAVSKNSFVNGQHFAGAGGHEHDIHQALLDDLLDLVAELSQGPIA